jgi:MOSC domain-containing protein YiiM
MMSVDSVMAISEGGLQGDRYANGAGFWRLTDSCQVTLISAHDLENARARSPLEFNQGNHRRNLVISGMKTRSLEGRTFSIGDAIFKYQKPRPPCGYLDKIQGQGMARALGRHSGVCLQILRSGRLAVGDRVEILDQDRV